MQDLSNRTGITQAANDGSTKYATDAYVDAADALKAPLASPALTGTPTTPTAAPLTGGTQIASQAYVDAAVTAGGGGSSLPGYLNAIARRFC